MKTIALALGGLSAAGMAAWMAAPTVMMAARGTVDQRTCAGWWDAAPVVVARPLATIPAPRRGDLDDRVSA